MIDEDDCAALIAERLNADALIIATDVEGVYTQWGTTAQRLWREVSAAELERERFAAGSMQPKVCRLCAAPAVPRRSARSTASNR